MNILLYGKVIKPTDIGFFSSLISELNHYKIKVFVSEDYQVILKENKIDTSTLTIIGSEYKQEEINNIDVLLSIGGDGTMLSSAIIVKDTTIPILGFNTGRMGFLANIDKENSRNAIQMLIKKQYTIDQRSMLKLSTPNNLFGKTAIALNDFTIQKKTSSSMITIHTHVNNEYFNSYWCNGLIVATPTGSTAFSMSCGGPIILPYAKNFVITPIAPHNLNIRPVVLPDDVSLSFEIESRSNDVFCTLDSRFEVIHPDQKLRISSNDFKVNLIKLEGQSYFTTLRNKLLWGKDVRNS